MVEGYVAVFALGFLAGCGFVYLALRPVLCQLRDTAAHWQKTAAGWEEQTRMRSVLLNAVLRMERARREVEAADEQARAAAPPRLTVVEK